MPDPVRKVLVIGSGPIVIGQAAEFDYAGSQACRSLREEGVEVVLVNSNPATIMTDREIADRVYIEPMDLDAPRGDHRRRAPRRPAAHAGRADRAQPGDAAVAGRHPAEATACACWARASSRSRWPRTASSSSRRCTSIGNADPAELSSPRASRRRWRLRKRMGFPLIIRPGFTLGGTGGGIAFNQEEFIEHRHDRPAAEPEQPDPRRAVRDRLEARSSTR